MYYGTGWGYSREFFCGSDARDYFAGFYRKMKSEVDQMSDAEIVSCNFEEWANYLAEKYFIALFRFSKPILKEHFQKQRSNKLTPFVGIRSKENILK